MCAMTQRGEKGLYIETGIWTQRYRCLMSNAQHIIGLPFLINSSALTGNLFSTEEMYQNNWQDSVVCLRATHFYWKWGQILEKVTL